MKIAFLTSSSEDYLADGILHGLRHIYGSDVVDYPKCEPLYVNCPADSFSRVRGHGFTLYKTLQDIEVDRFGVIERIKSGGFDRIIFGNIYRSYDLFLNLLPYLDPGRTILLDGEDTESIAPFSGKWWRRKEYWLVPAAHKRFNYYKREWGGGSLHSRLYKVFPRCVLGGWVSSMRLRSVSFCIPESKIISFTSVKTKKYTRHIVDPEVAVRVGRPSIDYAFQHEYEYYADIQCSQFGITTKRAGWDCLRHYEIAANGAVPCFRDLQNKPPTCAPHGLNSSNCISYTSYEDLEQKTNSLSSSDYEALRLGALDWARSNSTVSSARRIIANL